MLQACLGRKDASERGNYSHLMTSYWIIVFISGNWLHSQNQVQVGRSINYYRKAPLWRGIVFLSLLRRPADYCHPTHQKLFTHMNNYMWDCRLSQQSCTSYPGAKVNLKWILWTSLCEHKLFCDRMESEVHGERQTSSQYHDPQRKWEHACVCKTTRPVPVTACKTCGDQDTIGCVSSTKRRNGNTWDMSTRTFTESVRVLQVVMRQSCLRRLRVQLRISVSLPAQSTYKTCKSNTQPMYNSFSTRLILYGQPNKTPAPIY